MEIFTLREISLIIKLLLDSKRLRENKENKSDNESRKKIIIIIKIGLVVFLLLQTRTKYPYLPQRSISVGLVPAAASGGWNP